MARGKIHLGRPITDFELDLDENQLEVLGWAKVTRCKDCKHWITVMKDAEYGLCNNKIIGTRHKDEYCSRGEKDERNQEA